MKKAELWLVEYAEAHRNPLNQRIHTVAVPLIFWSIVAFLCTLPPLFLLLMLPALSFYFALGWIYGFSMVAMTLVSMMTAFTLMALGWPLAHICLAVFLMAWIAQFYGHKVEGKKPSFLTDLLFLLIGPLWVLQKIKSRLP